MKNDVPDSAQQTAQLQGRVTSPDARQVDPDAPSLPNSQSTPLQRVEPRQPLSELGQAAPVAPPPPPVPVDNTAKPILLYQPVAIAAGTIEASGYKIALEGIETLPIDETCSANDGVTWPCGMAARTAFRNWLRSRAIECNVPGQPSDELIATQCKLGNADLAQWLVENGWARAKDGTPMADVMKKAEEDEARDLWRSTAGPSSYSGSTNAVIWRYAIATGRTCRHTAAIDCAGSAVSATSAVSFLFRPRDRPPQYCGRRDRVQMPHNSWDGNADAAPAGRCQCLRLLLQLYRRHRRPPD